MKCAIGWQLFNVIIYEHINVDDDWCGGGCEAPLEKIFDPSSTLVFSHGQSRNLPQKFDLSSSARPV